jgi:transcription antitermination factor NusG
VRIIQGPFAPRVGVLLSADAFGIALVEIRIFDRETPVIVPAAWIRLQEDPPDGE